MLASIFMRSRAGIGWAGTRRQAGTPIAVVALFVAIAAGHVAGTAIVFHLNRVTSTGEPFFPAAGITLAALVLLPRADFVVATLLATFTSELAADLVIGETVGTALGSAFSNIAEPALGAALILAWIGHAPVLSRRRDLAVFLVCGVVAGPLLGAVIGPASTRLTPDYVAYWGVTGRWWTGDALGVLVVGGAIIAWATEKRWPFGPRYAYLEAAGLATSVVVLTWSVFWWWQPALVFLTIPLVGWAALRFGVRGATGAGLLIAAIALWATSTGHGLFAAVAHPKIAPWLLQVFVGVVVLMGLVLAAQVSELSQVEEELRTTTLAEREARLEARQVLAAERARMARELHDSVGHAVSVMVLQAGAARMTLPPDTDASRVVESIAETGRDVLGELDRLLGLLDDVGAVDRDGAVAPGGTERQPAYGLEHLGRLADTVRTTGLEVKLHMAADLPELPASLDQSMYRVIQEALTNTLKHADASRVEITIACPDRKSLAIHVIDDGIAGPSNQLARSFHRGRGLIGMQERVALFGGQIRMGPRPRGGWEVAASLPLSLSPHG
jgi:signal transduction histidine kinase